MEMGVSSMIAGFLRIGFPLGLPLTLTLSPQAGRGAPGELA
jgi:hypothetical protein